MESRTIGELYFAAKEMQESLEVFGADDLGELISPAAGVGLVRLTEAVKAYEKGMEAESEFDN